MTDSRVAVSPNNQQSQRVTAALTFTTAVSAATLHTHTRAPASTLPPSSWTSPSLPSSQTSQSSSSAPLPLDYSPTSSASSSSPPNSPNTHSLSSPPPPLPPTPTARLTDLCPSDKAKVGKLLLRVATLQAETQRHTHTDQQLKAVQEEHSRLQQQKAEVERRLNESMRLLKGYQERLREMEEQRGQRRERRKAKKDAEPMTDSAVHPSSTQMEVPWEGGLEGMGGEEKEEEVDPTHLHHLLHQQKVRVQQQMEELQQHAGSYHITKPSPHPRPAPHSPPSRRRHSPAVSHAGEEGQAIASSSLRASAHHLAASASLSSSHSSQSSSHGSRVPSRSPPVTVSVRYVKRSTAPSTSVPSTAPPPPLLTTTKSTSTSLSLSSRRSTDTLPRALSHSTSPPQRRPIQRIALAWEREEQRAREEEEEEEGEEDEETLLSQSSSPVSRRIQRLLSIQNGTASLKTRTPPPPPRPRPPPRTQPPLAGVKRPAPLHFPSSSSLNSRATRDYAQSSLLDADMQAVVEALNAVQTSPPSPPLSERLRQYDGQLLDTLSAFDV